VIGRKRCSYTTKQQRRKKKQSFHRATCAGSRKRQLLESNSLSERSISIFAIKTTTVLGVPLVDGPQSAVANSRPSESRMARLNDLGPAFALSRPCGCVGLLLMANNHSNVVTKIGSKR
jgi:hypothetical protein